jgi:antitoxin HicB
MTIHLKGAAALSPRHAATPAMAMAAAVSSSAMIRYAKVRCIVPCPVGSGERATSLPFKDRDPYRSTDLGQSTPWTTSHGKEAGADFESWLEETGIREKVTAAAIKAVIAPQLAGEMKKTGRAQIDRLLDPDNGSAKINCSVRQRSWTGRFLDRKILRTRAKAAAGLTPGGLTAGRIVRPSEVSQQPSNLAAA